MSGKRPKKSKKSSLALRVKAGEMQAVAKAKHVVSAIANEEWPKIAEASKLLKIERVVRVHEHLYKLHHNPLHAWAAYVICCRLGQPAPAWVVDYLYRSGEALLALIDQRPKRPEVAIKKAVGLATPKGGRGTVFTQFLQDLEALEIDNARHEESPSPDRRKQRRPYKEVDKQIGKSRAGMYRAQQRLS